jgi:pimeloyl-ACP methyl ester carboxylesterase
MRPIELILCTLTILTAIFYLLPRVSDRLKYRWIPALMVGAAALQIGLEGFRWQLWPVMVAVAILWLAMAVRRDKVDPARRPLFSAILGMILALLSLALGWVLPVPEPFPTTGAYQVGTTVFPLVDETRQELYGTDADAKREIMVQVWYPASPIGEEQRANFMPDIRYAGPALAEWIEIPSFALNHLKYARANAYLDAPVLEEGGEFPLLIFSHGWSGFREQNIYQVEELASHGYVVVGISHTYGAVITVFPDGRQMARDDRALPEGVSEEAYDLASNRLVRQWTADIGFVLDELSRRDQEEEWFLSGSLDLDKVGVFGHSTGGGATAEFCSTDPRCKAALTMDLWAEPVSDSVVSDGLWQPFMLMDSAIWANLEEPSENFRRMGDLIVSSSGEVIEIRIEGTVHHDFSALPLLTPLAGSFGLKGPIEGERGLTLINYYTVAFFDQYLRGIDQGLLEVEVSPFEEAQFNTRQ